jgi:ribosomal protein S18 acetylase RimI-like enzyme
LSLAAGLSLGCDLERDKDPYALQSPERSMISGDLVVRPFGGQDTEAVARLFVRAFAEKMRSLSGVPEEDWADLLVEAEVLPLSAHEGHLVAELEGAVVGVLSLDWQGRGTPATVPRPRSGRFSWWQRWKVRFAQWVITQRAKPGEAYVQYIGVDPGAQGNGVGTRLLGRGEVIARERGLTRCTLYVAAGNAGARRLYERLGFREEGSVRSMTTRWLFGVGEWVHMVKPLN